MARGRGSGVGNAPPAARREPPPVTLLDVARQAMLDLDACGASCALVGGLAVGARAAERTTRDADFVVAVDDDRGAERMTKELQARGYTLTLMLEQTDVGRLATVRLVSPVDGVTMVDILFASSGIEREIASLAEIIDVGGGVLCPVARSGHLLALKILARSDQRPHDDVDIAALLARIEPEELERARQALALIDARGFARGKRLDEELAAQLRRWLHPTT